MSKSDQPPSSANDQTTERFAFDYEDPGIQADPFALYRRLQAEAPVCKVELNGEPYWVLSRYDDIVSVLDDAATFSSDPANSPGLSGAGHLPLMILMDPPQHTRLRGALSKVFTAKRIKGFEPEIEKIAASLYQDYLDAGGGDFIAGFANALPVHVIGALVGVPTHDREQLRYLSDCMVRTFAISHGRRPDPEAQEGTRALLEYIGDLVRTYKETPADNMASDMIAVADDYDLTETEIVNFCAFLFAAGHETTQNLLGNGIEMLCNEPQLFERLRHEPENITKFVDEVLRYRSSLQRLSRIAMQDVEICGETIPKGGGVRLLVGAGNRDGKQFPHGENFNIDAGAKRHLAFGRGIHRCVGAPLAHLEARIAFKLILQSTQSLKIDTDHPATPVIGGTISEYGNRTLHLIVEADPRSRR